AVRAVVQATLAILLLTGHAHVWELAVGATLYGAATAFFDPASNALVPETVPVAELQQANSLLGLPQSFFSIGGAAPPRRVTAGFRTGLLFARAAAGVLIAVFGTGWLCAVDAAPFLVSLICLALLRVPARAMPPPASFLADLGEGWHELAIRPWYWITLCAHACGNFTLPAFFVLGPVIAARIALPPLALAFSDSVALITVALVVFAFEVVWSNSIFSSTIQALIPDQVRSRVDSYDMLISVV